MKLSIGFSPCPNDTFIFDAWVNKKIDSEGIDLDVRLADVQQLNEWAMHGDLDITKISYAVLPLVLEEYIVLNAGGALGKGVGPLLIGRPELQMENGEWRMENFSVAVPGENTTAHLLFSTAFPKAKNKRFMIFSDIENAVLNKEVDAGVIIHENRFTYESKGLKKIIDLGDHWEKVTGQPIPLGGIIIKRNIENSIQQKINQLIQKSITYAYQQLPSISPYIREHSQEMDEHVMRQHINLYVNNYSVDLGTNGKAAVMKLLEVFNYKGRQDIFIA
jgi:1,4-dihydroxy-6-naphthoate synthase